jgi:signal transduction histidine kinase
LTSPLARYILSPIILRKETMRLPHQDEFIAEIARSIQETRNARSFLNEFPCSLQKHFPFARCILYYKEPEGNIFRPFSGDPNEKNLPHIHAEANLIESFTNRSEFLLATVRTRSHFDLFNRDSDDLFKSKGLNLVIPLRTRKYFRGLLLAGLADTDMKSVSRLAAAAQTAAAMFIPLIEAEQMEFANDKNYYRLFKFDRLVLLGQMAASMAHELRTPLSTVLFEISAMKSQLPQNKEINAAYDKINREIARADQMIESLLEFSKFREPDIAPVMLHEFCQRILQEIPAHKIPPGLKISLQGEKEIQVTSDGNRLKQVFMNVFFNALEALNGMENSEIKIRIYSEHGHLPKNIRHIIAITDNGPGIPAAIRENVLQPFFTTKKEGTGLGLYISCSIMKTLKGDLEIQSSGQGTRVNLILPGR